MCLITPTCVTRSTKLSWIRTYSQRYWWRVQVEMRLGWLNDPVKLQVKQEWRCIVVNAIGKECAPYVKMAQNQKY